MLHVAHKEGRQLELTLACVQTEVSAGQPDLGFPALDDPLLRRRAVTLVPAVDENLPGSQRQVNSQLHGTAVVSPVIAHIEALGAGLCDVVDLPPMIGSGVTSTRRRRLAAAAGSRWAITARNGRVAASRCGRVTASRCGWVTASWFGRIASSRRGRVTVSRRRRLPTARSGAHAGRLDDRTIGSLAVCHRADIRVGIRDRPGKIVRRQVRDRADCLELCSSQRGTQSHRTRRATHHLGCWAAGRAHSSSSSPAAGEARGGARGRRWTAL